VAAPPMAEDLLVDDDPLWYKDAVIYELHVRTFSDSNGDGIGDFRGLTAKLDYLQDLGVTAIWLLPFYPSPLRDDGYDIADYTNVHPDYGSLHEFKVFLREAHRRNLRVITELVINHTSDQHPWFARARRARRASSRRDYYVWSDSAERYHEARIIFKDFESSNWAWDPQARAYYWHRFYSHQPDLNFDNPQVRRAVTRNMDFWLGLGVDGMRLDAVPYLFEREGTICENLPETHAFLKELRAHIDARFAGRMLLAEANQWPEDARAYFGDADECHMAFHFPVMPRLFMGVHMEDRFPIMDILEQTPAIPDACQWAVFLRNHDELTLEMVTDEERDYMYRVYAHDPKARINLGIRRRLAPLLGNNRRRIELLNGLLLSLPGTPIIYYGDELGMGDNIYLGDRNGVRTPMQWSPDRNAGFSRANPQKLYLPAIIDPEYHFEALNVESQQANPNSLLWWMKRLIALRKRYRAFGRGDLAMLHPENNKILAFVRSWQRQQVLVVANLSRFAQYAELDLAAYAGSLPVEPFGSSEFPPIGDKPYPLTLGPHSFYWFSLEPAREEIAVDTAGGATEPPLLSAVESWRNIFSNRRRATLADAIAVWLPQCRWFMGKTRRLKAVHLVDQLPFQHSGADAAIVLAAVDFADGEGETYVLPLSWHPRAAGEEILRRAPSALVARLRVGRDEPGVLLDALSDPSFTRAFLEAIGRRRRFRGEAGTLTTAPTPAYRRLLPDEGVGEPGRVRGEQSNSSVTYASSLILKLFRRFQPGENPDLEIGRYLTRKGFPHVPHVGGAIEYAPDGAPSGTLAMVQEFVPNEGDAWSFTLDELGRFFERVRALPVHEREYTVPALPIIDLLDVEVPAQARDLIATYLESARLIGTRTGELHMALASETSDEAFVPEQFTSFVRRSIHQAMRSQAERVFDVLVSRRRRLPEEIRRLAGQVLDQREAVLSRFNALLGLRGSAQRTRCHGDFHLGQLLFTGRDFVIIDFEGEPARPVSERRIKRSPLRDVAGMMRSFHYAACSEVFRLRSTGLVAEDGLPVVEAWASYWYRWVCEVFLKAYLAKIAGAAFLPSDSRSLAVLLDAYLLDKAVYEVGYELNSRPGWAAIPLRGILDLLAVEGG
jgi:maltose alpha-D-glucosyltransferase / alpha-amylase